MFESLFKPMDWDAHKEHWPNSACSQRVPYADLLWHVQRRIPTHTTLSPTLDLAEHAAASPIPKILLLHGTGASTHTWRDMLEPLSQWADVLALDLPGHAFTGLSVNRRAVSEEPLSVSSMSGVIAGLLKQLAFEPDALVGHSAGAAVAAQLVASKALQPKIIIGLNPAWSAFAGAGGLLLTLMAKAIALNPLAPIWFANKCKSPKFADPFVHNTGSKLNEHGLGLYRTLMSHPTHVRGVLSMMASWKLEQLMPQLPGLNTRVRVIVGTQDQIVNPRASKNNHSGFKDYDCILQEGLGHLAHEESALQTAEQIKHWCLQA